MTESRHRMWISELSLDVCWRLLAEQAVGRVGFVRGGRPLVLPVNHAVDGHTIVFRADRSAALGQLVDLEPVAFEVDALDPTTHTGWSVLVKGEVALIGDVRSQRDVAEPELRAWAPGEKDEWIRIVPLAVTGRLLSNEPTRPSGSTLPA